MSQSAFGNGRALFAIIISRLAYFNFLIVMLLLSSCSPSPEHQERQLDFERNIEINSISLKVAVFETKEERSLGLMRVKHLEPLTGALFIYPQPSAVNFWMGNTYIPLDILYFDEHFSLVGIVKDAQPCVKKPCLVYPAKGIHYVVEVNAGFVDRYTIGLGSTLSL